MKKVINGKTYNPDTAEQLCSHTRYGNGNRLYRGDLYRTKKGRYFECIGRADSRDFLASNIGIYPMKEDEAKKYVEDFGTAEEYIYAFGEPDEA